MPRSTEAGFNLTTETLNRNGIAASPSFSSDVFSYPCSSEGADHVRSRLEFAPSTFSVTEQAMSDGVQGTYECAAAMCDAVLGRIGPDYSGFDDPWVSDLAERITRGSRSPREEVEKIWQYACGIPYQPHPPTVQVVKDARRAVESGESDCVGLTVLICTLTINRGYPARFILQYWNDEELYTHVLPEVFVDGRWLVCDAVARDLSIDSLQKLPDGGFNVTWEIS